MGRNEGGESPSHTEEPDERQGTANLNERGRDTILAAIMPHVSQPEAAISGRGDYHDDNRYQGSNQ